MSLLALCAFSLSIRAEVNRYEETKRNIISNNTRIFDTKLFKVPFPQKDSASWESIINDVKDFVDDNSEGDSSLGVSFELIRIGSGQLINSIRVTYNSLFGTQGVLPTEEEKATMRSAFESVRLRMQAVQDNLAPQPKPAPQEEVKLSKKKQKKQAAQQAIELAREQTRDILFTLAMVIKLGCVKATNQIEAECIARLAGK